MLSGREGCASRLGTSSGVGKGQVVVGRKTPLSLVEALLPSNQEVMSQNNQGHMMMPSAPEAQFIVVHAQFSFRFLEALFNGPPHPTEPDQEP